MSGSCSRRTNVKCLLMTAAATVLQCHIVLSCVLMYIMQHCVYNTSETAAISKLLLLLSENVYYSCCNTMSCPASRLQAGRECLYLLTEVSNTLLRHKVLSCILACRKDCSVCSCSPSNPGTTWPLLCVMITGFWNSSASFREYCMVHNTPLND